MNKNIYICYTYYHLYVSLLEIFYSKNSENYLIITDHISNAIELKERIIKSNIVKGIYYVEDLKLKKIVLYNPLFSIFYRFILSKLFEFKNKELYEKFKNNEKININMFLDSTTTSHFYMYNFKNNYLLEDGTLTYYPRKMVLKDYLYKILLIPQRVGRDKKIKKIKVQKPEELPKDIREKGEKLELSLYEKKLKEEQKEILFSIFSFNIELSNIKKKRCLILTQPLSEMKLVTENEKIQIYTKIIKKFSDYEIYLKKHPKDTTDYSFNVKMLDKNFPIELIKLLPNNFFEKIVAIESSAINNLEDIAECINLGFKINDKLYKNMMKDKLNK